MRKHCCRNIGNIFWRSKMFLKTEFKTSFVPQKRSYQMLRVRRANRNTSREAELLGKNVFRLWRSWSNSVKGTVVLLVPNSPTKTGVVQASRILKDVRELYRDVR